MFNRLHILGFASGNIDTKLGDLERNWDQLDNSQKHKVNFDAYFDLVKIPH